jgi:hypothetical protein
VALGEGRGDSFCLSKFYPEPVFVNVYRSCRTGPPGWESIPGLL